MPHRSLRWPASLALLPLLLLLVLSSNHPVHAHGDSDDHDHDDDSLEFVTSNLPLKLPKPLSDLTATVMDDSSVYLAGGCDHIDGSVFYAEGNQSGFRCPSLSDALFVYRNNTGTPTVQQVATLPRPRYRHAAVGIRGRVMLIGGRDVDDNLIPEVDVYDVASNSWTTYTDLNPAISTSDLTAFAYKDQFLLIVGGYNLTYGAQSNVWLIDTNLLPAGSTTIPPEAVQAMAPLSEARADIAGALDPTTRGGLAYVSGGFTHSNEFCEPLATVEVYHFDSDSWETLPPMQFARSDKGVALLDDHLYTIGGERQIEGRCTTLGSPVSPGDLTVAVDVVERYDIDTQSWSLETSLPVHRFRFPAVVLPDAHEILTFGGQQAYNEGCKCLRGTTDIIVYREEVVEGGNTGTSSATSTLDWIRGVIAGVFVAAVVAGL